MTWNFDLIPKRRPVIKNPILIVGMPGIGSVGKLTADFIIDELKARPLYDISSYDMPNSVFVNEKSIVELPKIEIFHKQLNSFSVLILTGDVQPGDDRSCYEFCESVLDLAEELKVSKIITLGGIGLSDVPAKPAVFCTGNSKKDIKEFIKGTKANDKLFGVVGPIIGVAGLLIGLAKKRDIPAFCLLAETLGHPAYIGIKGAKGLLTILNKKLKLRINIKELERDIEEIEEELIHKSQEISKLPRNAALKKIQTRLQKETSYIG